MTSIGAPLDRVDGPLKVCGQAHYTGDLSLPRMAHAVLVTSTIASGRVTRIDAAAAERSPGVVAVISHVNAMRLPQDGKAAVDPPAGRVLSLLQDDRVAYSNQPVALVVAGTFEQAVGAAALVRVTTAQLSTQSSIVEVLDVERCSSAVSRPCASAPARTVCAVHGRPPTGPNSCGRCITSRTGRPSWRAASAARITCDHAEPLPPNAPPTNAERTCTRSGEMPKVLASVLRTPATYWVESSTDRRSPSQLASVACGSIGL